MRRALLRLMAFVAVSLAVSGCVRSSDIVFHGIDDVSLSMKSLSLVLDVENSSGSKITVRDMTVSVTDGSGATIVKALAEGDVVVPKRSRSDVTVPLKLSLNSPLRAMALLGASDDVAESLYVTLNATVKLGCVRKRLNIEKVPLSEFMRYGLALGK